jgi:peptidoglycan/xylan/chitin deacetylase (PgdA/CDA1 family)
MGSCDFRKKSVKIAILAGNDSEYTRTVISALCHTEGIEIEAVLSAFPRGKPFRRRLLDLVLRSVTCYVSEEDIDNLLRRAFPEKPFSIVDLQRFRGAPVYQVMSLGGAAARNMLQQGSADYWVLLCTDVPSWETVAPRSGYLRATLEAPADIRRAAREGTPARVTIDLLAPGGDAYVAADASILPHARETAESLQTKFEMEAPLLFARVLKAFAGEAPLLDLLSRKSAKTPETEQPKAVIDRSVEAYRILKLTLYSLIFHIRIFHLLRQLRGLLVGEHARVLAYHRVNDYTRDPLTAGTRQFAEHLLALQRYYSVVSTTQIVEWVREGAPLPPHAVAIHFDDCYQDVYTNGGRILAALQLPACAFISSGFVDTDRQFQHDQQKCPFHPPNLRREDVAQMTEMGFEIGAHTVNHTNLGGCTMAEAQWEIERSKADLEAVIQKPIELFAFPFGLRSNLQDGIPDLIRKAGFSAMFSAYGGYITRRSDPYDLQRVGMSGQFRALEMLFEIEGFTPGAILDRRAHSPYGH